MGVTENKIVECWHNCLNGHEFEQIPGDSEGKPGVLQFMGLQRAGHGCVTEKHQSWVNKEAPEVCHST